MRAFEVEDSARPPPCRPRPSARGPSAARRDGGAHAPRAGARGAVDRLAVLASGNENKLRELRHALPGWELELLDADDYPPEDGDTYYENARAKAEFGRTVEPQRWVLGEDSGIEIEGLGGGPGVKSSRWAAGREAERAIEELRGRRRRGPPRALCLRARRAGARRNRAPRHGHPRRPDRRGTKRHRRLRLRPGLHPRGRRANRCPAWQRLESRQLPPRPSRCEPSSKRLSPF